MNYLTETQLPNWFKIKHLPIKDGEWWNGKPNTYSNLPKWNIDTSQRFGQNLLNYSQFGLKGHNGIDFAYNFRTPVVAPCKMWVSYVQDDAGGYGRNVWGETENVTVNGDTYKLEMCFGHFDEIVAKAGRWTEEGSIIGYGDSTGFSTGNHLHFGIRPQIKYSGGWKQLFNDNGYLGWIDPEPFIPKIRWTAGELENNNNDMIETNVKLVKDQDSSAVGFFVPADTPEALISLGKNFGIAIAKKDPGNQVDWDSLNIQGKVILN